MPRQIKDYHPLHTRVEMPVWRRMRKAFPEHGMITHIINRALEDFMDKWEDIDNYLVKCAKLMAERQRARRRREAYRYSHISTPERMQEMIEEEVKLDVIVDPAGE